MKRSFWAAAVLLAGIGATAIPAAAQDLIVKGQVLEIQEVESYTYLRLKTKDGERWAAVSKAPVKKGAEVTISNATEMRNFESKSLKKTFDRIVFGTIGDGKDAGHPHGGAAPTAAAAVADVKVPKASGPDAKTVAEIVGGKAGLKDKPVVVRGRVVKFTPDVMGKNWVHLRDGSGSAKDGSNDILVTTKDQAQVGSIVVAKGVVRTDADFGSGYAYKVLIEEAALQK